MSIYRPKFIDEWRAIKREGGYKRLFKEKGWTILLAFILFYLIRDTILYIIIPYMGYSIFTNCF